MKTRLYFLLLLMVIEWGCYEDKGNYDYKEINEVSFYIEPASNSAGRYIYRQPVADTLRVTYHAVASQTMREAGDNLSFRWIVTKGQQKDTVDAPELTLVYPPKKSTYYTVLLQVKDAMDNISYYAQYIMQTRLPFMKSWLVLHGNAGDRKIGAIEDPDSTTTLFTSDVFQELYQIEGVVKNAEHLLYTASNSVSLDINKFAQLIVTGSNRMVNYMYPYNFAFRKSYLDIIPNLDAPEIIGGCVNNCSSFLWLLDNQHKLYHSGGDGLFFSTKTEPQLSNYEASKLWVSEMGYSTIWDETNRKLMYYMNQGNIYKINGMENQRQLTSIPSFRTKITLPDGNTRDREILWVGKRINQGEGSEGATILVKDTVFTFHQINYNLKGGVAYKLDSMVVKKMDIDRNTCFTTSVAFANQIFFSNGSSLYVLNTVNGEQRMLYSAPGLITQLYFRSIDPLDKQIDNDENFKLGVVVNLGDSGELHELYLTQASDVKSVKVHSGFGPIEDICYVLVRWVD